jgi:hypothetical protein
MHWFRTIAIFMAALGITVVLAGFFLSGPVEHPLAIDPKPAANTTANPPASPAVNPPQSSNEVPSNPPLPSRRVRTIPFTRPIGPTETTGTGQLEPPVKQPAATQGIASPENGRSCDREACSRTYRSFDSTDCTYQPYHGGPRQLCEK